jgi:hypothetical protein
VLGEGEAEGNGQLQDGRRVTHLWQCLDCGAVAELGKNVSCQSCGGKSVTTKIYIDPASRPTPVTAKPDRLIGLMVGASVTHAPAGVRLLSLVDRMCSYLFGCCSHTWSRPMTLPGWQYPIRYDSHQACVNCGVERYFDFGRMIPGPMFRRKYGRDN